MKRILISTLFAILILAACFRAPTVQVQRVEVTRIVEIPVTVISEVEATRFVPLTRLVPVTFEVTREREIEVTRIVDKVIIVAPSPTVTPIKTPTAPVTEFEENEPDLPAPLGSELLATMINVRNNMQSYGFHIDSGIANGYLNCPAIIALHDRVAAAPPYDIAGSGPTVQNSYYSYQDAISIFLQGVNPLTQNCRQNPSNSICIGPNQARGCNGFIPEIQWSTARAIIIDADDGLSVAITNLDREFDVSN